MWLSLSAKNTNLKSFPPIRLSNADVLTLSKKTVSKSDVPTIDTLVSLVMTCPLIAKSCKMLQEFSGQQMLLGLTKLPLLNNAYQC